MQTPLISVCLITYNHVNYIKQAIEGVLEQQLQASWEFIIADDFSTDGAREIIKSYQQRFPDRIRLIFQEKNVGPLRNWLDLIGAAKGKYIAYFEGDDYWTDPAKLQKQMDFLETHQDYAICIHAVHELLGEKEEVIRLAEATKTYTIEDLAEYGNFIHTVSAVFRNNIATLPEWLINCPVGDYPLHMWNARIGEIYYMPEAMAAYRKFTGIYGPQKLSKKYVPWYKTLDILIGKFNDQGIDRQLRKQQAACILHWYNDGAEDILNEQIPPAKELLDMVVIKTTDQMARFKTSFLFKSLVRKIMLSLRHNVMVDKVESFKARNR